MRYIQGTHYYLSWAATFFLVQVSLSIITESACKAIPPSTAFDHLLDCEFFLSSVTSVFFVLFHITPVLLLLLVSIFPLSLPLPPPSVSLSERVITERNHQIRNNARLRLAPLRHHARCLRLPPCLVSPWCFFSCCIAAVCCKREWGRGGGRGFLFARAEEGWADGWVGVFFCFLWDLRATSFLLGDVRCGMVGERGGV